MTEPQTATTAPPPPWATTTLVPALKPPSPPPSLLPVFRGAQMSQAIEVYRDLQIALDRGMPDQLQQIRGKAFRKKGYWRAVARAFNLSVECRSEERYTTTDKDWGWRVIYRAITPTGAFEDGDGACAASEKADDQDTEHNVRAHAHSRGFNRAVSNLVGFGEVSAEELKHEEMNRRRPIMPPETQDMRPSVARDLPEGSKIIITVDHVTGAKTKAWVHLSDRSKLPVYNRDLVTLCDEVCQNREPVWLETKQSAAGHWYLTGLKRQGPDTPVEVPDPPSTDGMLTDDDVPF